MKKVSVDELAPISTEGDGRGDCIVKPVGHVNIPDAPLSGSFERSKSNKSVSFSPELNSSSRVGRWKTSLRGGTADRQRSDAKAMPFNLYRHGADVEAQAVRKYCRFHRLNVNDLPREMLLTEIQMSSLGTVGWAFAEVHEWHQLDDVDQSVGGCCSVRPNTLTPTTKTTTTTTTTNELQQMCEKRVRDKLLENMDDELVEVLRALGTFDEVVRKTVAIIETREAQGGNDILPIEQWIDRTIEVTLDSGACDHILDLTDAPGYAQFLAESPGSRRDQMYVVGNGAEVPNEGQVTLNLAADGGSLIKSVFQVAEITRPLMSVSKICALGHRCVFDEDKAEVICKNGTILCTFKRKGGLYVATMTLKSPEGFQRPER